MSFLKAFFNRQIAVAQQRDIIRVEETYSDARKHFDDLASRDIGGVCIRGVAPSNIHELHPATELWRFMRDATVHTSTTGDQGQILQLRRRPRATTADAVGPLVVFGKGIELHLDGFITEYDLGDRILAVARTPLLRQSQYLGASHLITLTGGTTFGMRRLTRGETDGIKPENSSESIHDSFALPPLGSAGQTIRIDTGDYMAIHSYAVHGMPIYAHGTMDATSDRQSVALNPVLPVLLSQLPTMPPHPYEAA